MNGEQINHLNMSETTLQFFASTTAIWSSNPAISAVVATATSHVNAINATSLAQKTSSKGTTQTKQEAQLAMAIAAVTIANAGKAYAAATANTILYDLMNHSQTQIMRATDNDADDICQNILNDITPYIGSTTVYGAMPSSLTNLQNLINTFTALIGKPNLQKSIVTTATLTLAQHFSALNALFKTQLDPLMMQYQASNLVFYNQYLAVRTINDLGHRHTVSFIGFIYNNSNTALANATVSLTGTATHGKITNATGKYKFTRLHTGTYTITVTAVGYVTQTHNFTITANGTTHSDFIMIGDGGVGSGIGVGTV